MFMKSTAATIVSFLVVTSSALAACVENGTPQRLVFTIEDRGSDTRIAAWLEPDGSLCMPTTQGAVFTAFESQESVEGCPRLSGPNDWDRLEHFLPTDSCRWASHGDQSADTMDGSAARTRALAHSSAAGCTRPRVRPNRACLTIGHRFPSLSGFWPSVFWLVRLFARQAFGLQLSCEA